MGSRRGLPQGLISSDVLATVYLTDLDFTMIQNNFRYVRHGDDVRIAVKTYDQGCLAIRCLEAKLRQLGLLLNSEKTRVLHRATYEETVSSYQQMHRDAENQIIRTKTQNLAKDEGALQSVMLASGMEELAWDFFYHAIVDFDYVIETLQPEIKPDQVEIAAKLFLDAIKKQPGSKEALSQERFHQQLTWSLVRLSAARSDIGLDYVGELIQSYPEKTGLLCQYMLSLKGKEKAVASQVEGMIREDLTEWGLAWLVRVLSEVSEHVSDETLTILKKYVERPQTRWLAAVEVAKLLAARKELKHDSLLMMWNTCPAVFKVDLVVAAVRMGRSVPWAAAFVSAAKSNPIHAVAIRHEGEKAEANRSQMTGKP